jgi:hypothetical protein
MKIRPHLIAAAIVAVFFPHWPASGADFGSRGDEPRLSKPAGAGFYHYRSLREAVDACESRRSFETVGDENSDFDPAIGCSSSANLAAMMSHRRDLVRGQSAPHHDAEHASNAIGQYRASKTPRGSEQVSHASDPVNRVR